MRTSRRIAALLALTCLHLPGLEVSTGFLIGPRHDPRAFYFRQQPGSAWQKSQAGRESRGPALGFRRVLLQSPDSNAFHPDGRLRADEFDRLQAMLAGAARESVAVELVLFHPDQDQSFDSPGSIDLAIVAVIDWLIDRNHRHVIVNPGGDWSAPGWDFDHYIPQHATQFAQVIRDRFQARKTDYLLPVAISLASRLTPGSPLVQEADVLVVSGEALSSDPRTVDRPMLVFASGGGACGPAAQRFSGCVADAPVVVK